MEYVVIIEQNREESREPFKVAITGNFKAILGTSLVASYSYLVIS